MNTPDNPDFELNAGPSRVWLRLAAAILLVALAALIAWSVVTEVDEVAKARGDIQPIAQVRKIESRHGGTVDEVMVAVGDQVKQGDVLVSFDRVEARSAHEAAKAKIAGLALELERLDAFVEERSPDFSTYEGEYPELVVREHAALESRNAFLEARRSVLTAQMHKKISQIESLDASTKEFEAQLASAKQQLDVQQDLFDRGLAVRPRLAELVEQVAAYNLDLVRNRGDMAVARAELEEIIASLQQVRSDDVAQARARMVEALNQKRALESEAAALESRLDETEIRAPLSGLVQSLPDASQGDVVDPGGLVATVVPLDGGLRFSGRITPRDVAFVTPGQPVRLKIDSFDFSRFGALPGEVETVSPTTDVDRAGNVFYEVRVGLDNAYFRNAEDGLIILPGMTGEADIVTDRKTVFQYIWKPIYTNLDLALSER